MEEYENLLYVFGQYPSQILERQLLLEEADGMKEQAISEGKQPK